MIQASQKEDPDAVEKESAAGAKVKKKSPWPWILAATGVVAAGVLVYFLAIKKTRYSLDAAVGDGVNGTPAAGRLKYKKGEIVQYSYSLSGGGFKDLAVTLDGVAVPTSGFIIMDRDHSLSSGSAKIVSVVVNSTPAGAVIYDNGKKIRLTTPATFEYAEAGLHTYLLRLCGYQDCEETVRAEAGIQKTVNATLKPGIGEEFTYELSPCWKTKPTSTWKVDNGVLKATGPLYQGNYMFYDLPFNQTSYTLTARMNMVVGTLWYHASLRGIVLGVGNDMNSVQGYWFTLLNPGDYQIQRVDNLHIVIDRGWWDTVLASGSSTSISDLGGWNTVKITRSGPAYSFSVNDKLLATFSDDKYDPRCVIFYFYSGGGSEAEAWYEYVHMDMAAASTHFRGVLLRAPGK